MPVKTGIEHRGYPTIASLKAFAQDNTLLLECEECGAWVGAATNAVGDLELEKHLDRRPKAPNRNRLFKIKSGRGF